MFYNPDDVEVIKNRIDLLEYVSKEYEKMGKVLKKAGSDYKGECVFHNEKSASLYITPSKNIYHCFGCNASGDAIKFYRDYHKATFYEAIEYFAKFYNLPLREAEEKNDTGINKKIFRGFYSEAIKFYHEQLMLPENKKYLDYLIDRGLSIEYIIDKKIGLSLGLSDFCNKMAKIAPDHKQYLELTGIGYLHHNTKNNTKYYIDSMSERIVFPIYDKSKIAIGLMGRDIAEPNERYQRAKYKNTKDTIEFKKSLSLYGIEDLKIDFSTKNIVYLLEGNMDVSTMKVLGFKNSVANMGTAFSKDQAVMIKRYTDTVVIMYDADKAGKEATCRTINILKKYDFNVIVIDLEKSGCKDINEFAVKSKNDKKIINQYFAKNHFECFQFLVKEYSEGLDFSKVIDKKAFLKKFIDFFSNVSLFERESYSEKMASIMNVRKETILKYFEEECGFINKDKKQNITQEKSNINSKIETKSKILLTPAEKITLSYMTDSYDNLLKVKALGVTEQSEFIKTAMNILLSDDVDKNNLQFSLVSNLEDENLKKEVSLALFTKVLYTEDDIKSLYAKLNEIEDACALTEAVNGAEINKNFEINEEKS